MSVSMYVILSRARTHAQQVVGQDFLAGLLAAVEEPRGEEVEDEEEAERAISLSLSHTHREVGQDFLEGIFDADEEPSGEEVEEEDEWRAVGVCLSLPPLYIYISLPLSRRSSLSHTHIARRGKTF